MEISQLSEIVMNPVRQRIIQFLITSGKGTPADILQKLPDVPPASLYRHMKKLLSAGCIEVVEEKKIRGTIEKTYALCKDPVGQNPTNQELGKVFYQLLLSMQGTFLHYFADEQADPQKDMLLLQTATLLMSDEEFMKLLTDIGALLAQAASNELGAGRKVRRLSFISSPNEK